MKRLLLWTLALVIAAAPAVAEVCRLDCARPDPPACPLHQKAPRPCAHDHAISAADLTRGGVDLSRPLVAAITVTFHLDALAPVTASLHRGEHQHAPPFPSHQLVVLRI
jgi:hypothetical protein